MKIQQNTASYTPMPEGTHQAVIVDILDYGWPENDYNGQPKPPVPVIELVFQILDTNSFGERYEIRSKKQYISWGKNSSFPKFLSQIVGQNTVTHIIETGECKMDELLIGRNVWLAIEHVVKGNGADKRTFAEIITIMAFDSKQGPKMEPDNYVRVCDRPGYRAPVPSFEDDNEDRFVSTSPLFVRANGGTYSPPDFMKYAEAGEYGIPPVTTAPRPKAPQLPPADVPMITRGRIGEIRSLARGKLENDTTALQAFIEEHSGKRLVDYTEKESDDLLQKLRALPDPDEDMDDIFGDDEDNAASSDQIAQDARLMEVPETKLPPRKAGSKAASEAY